MAHRLPLSDIQFIADFAAFARSKGGEGYRAGRPDICALAQFGYPWARAGDVPDGAYNAATCESTVGEHTFSALADRLEAVIADAPVVERAS